MTYFQDLTLYSYLGSDQDAAIATLNVGWLDSSMPHEQGITLDEFKEKLLFFCCPEFVVHQCCGYHQCQFCDNPPFSVQAHSGDKEIWLGNGEIRAIGKTAIYAAPTLIYHYVVVHNYQPPAEFVEAVLNGPQPGSNTHRALIDKLGH